MRAEKNRSPIYFGISSLTGSGAKGTNWKAYRSASRSRKRSRTGLPASGRTSPPCRQRTTCQIVAEDLGAVVQGEARDRPARGVLDFDLDASGSGRWPRSASGCRRRTPAVGDGSSPPAWRGAAAKRSRRCEASAADADAGALPVVLRGVQRKLVRRIAQGRGRFDHAPEDRGCRRRPRCPAGAGPDAGRPRSSGGTARRRGWS